MVNQIHKSKYGSLGWPLVFPRRNRMRRMIFLAIVICAIGSAAAAESIAELKATAEAASKAALAAPNDYAANWMASKALQDYGDRMKTDDFPSWKDLGKVASKDGMKFGDIAINLNRRGVEGWYYYGLNVGTYSDSVSIFSALAEGLKDKTQKAFETAYSLDKTYDTYGPILTLGRFWQVLPGIAGRDLNKAEKLFDEYISSAGSSPKVNKDAYYFRGALYKDRGRNTEAKADLQKAADMGQKDAIKLLASMK